MSSEIIQGHPTFQAKKDREPSEERHTMWQEQMLKDLLVGLAAEIIEFSKDTEVTAIVGARSLNQKYVITTLREMSANIQLMRLLNPKVAVF